MKKKSVIPSNNLNLKNNLDSELSEEMRLRNEVKHIESIYVNEIQLTLGDEFKSDNLKEEKDSLKKRRSNQSEKYENFDGRN